MSNKRGAALSWLGLLLCAAAVAVCAYNVWDSARAAESAAQLLRQWEVQTAQTAALPETGAAQYPEAAPQATKEAALCDVIGVLEIPSLALRLPVLSESSDALLKRSVCRFAGSVKNGTAQRFVIAGHNYKSHFGALQQLAVGDTVLFTATGGTLQRYCVTELAEIDAAQGQLLEEGTWDITLFTCNFDGRKRLLVRCCAQT